MGNNAKTNVIVTERGERSKIYHLRGHGHHAKCGMFVSGSDKKFTTPPKGFRLCGNCARAKS